jgi:hypothetical protein
MKRTLLTSFLFLCIGGVVMAQERPAKKPAATTATNRIPKSDQKAVDARQIALKKAAQNENTTSTKLQKATGTTAKAHQ